MSDKYIKGDFETTYENSKEILEKYLLECNRDRHGDLIYYDAISDLNLTIYLTYNSYNEEECGYKWDSYLSRACLNTIRILHDKYNAKRRKYVRDIGAINDNGELEDPLYNVVDVKTLGSTMPHIEILELIVSTLTYKKHSMIVKLHLIGVTQDEISSICGYSQAHVSRIIKKFKKEFKVLYYG